MDLIREVAARYSDQDAFMADLERRVAASGFTWADVGRLTGIPETRLYGVRHRTTPRTGERGTRRLSLRMLMRLDLAVSVLEGAIPPEDAERLLLEFRGT